jgi:hypothetical protein
MPVVGFAFVGFTLVVGLASLGLALSLALRPGERQLAVLRPLSVSTVFASVAALCAGVGVCLKNVADGLQQAAAPATTVLLVAGLAEAVAPAMLGFSLLAVAWLLAAVGLRKQL